MLDEDILSKLPWFPRWLRLIVLGIAGMVIVPYLLLWKAFTSDNERMERGQSGRLQTGDLDSDWNWTRRRRRLCCENMVFFDSILGLVSLGNFKLKGSVPKYAATASLNRGGGGGLGLWEVLF